MNSATDAATLKFLIELTRCYVKYICRDKPELEREFLPRFAGQFAISPSIVAIVFFERAELGLEDLSYAAAAKRNAKRAGLRRPVRF